MRIDWSSRSLDEIEEIGEYIAAERPGAAAAWIDRLVTKVERLSVFPRSGRLLATRLDHGYELREIIYLSHRVIYRAFEDRVEILGVVHSRRTGAEEQ